MLGWLAETTVVALAVAVAVTLLCRWLRPRPAVRHALWLVVLLKLLTPPLFAWPWPTSALPAPIEESPPPAPIETRTEPSSDEPLSLPPSKMIVLAPPIAPIDDPEPPSAIEPAPIAEEPSPPTAVGPPPAPIAPPAWKERAASVLVGIWLCGAMLMALLQLIRIARFRLQVAGGQPAPVPLVTLVDDVASLLGVRPPPVVVVSGLASPMVWAFGRARLLWPAALLGGLSPDGERAAVVHELAHLRRRDHWVGWLQLIACCVWWWNPLYWHVRRQLGRAAELACDAWVIETLPQARRAYAETLLAVCELVSRRAAPVPALGMGGLRQEIERRLTMILRESVPSRAPVRALFGVVLLALIALPGFTDGQPPAEPARTDNKADVNAVPANAVQPAAKQPLDEREQRLQKLEATLETLIKEVKDLRTAGKTANPPKSATDKAQTPPALDAWRIYTNQAQVAPNDNEAIGRNYGVAPAAGQPGQSIHLERVSYTLSKDKADALAALLKDLKAPVLETQVKPDGIVVTTTPAAQRIVGEFVGLIQGHTPAGHNKTSQGSPYYPPAD